MTGGRTARRTSSSPATPASGQFPRAATSGPAGWSSSLSSASEREREEVVMRLPSRTWAWAVCQALLVLAPAASAEQPDWATHPENRWVKRSPREGAPAPAFGWEGSGDYDPHHRKWIHFG